MRCSRTRAPPVLVDLQGPLVDAALEGIRKAWGRAGFDPDQRAVYYLRVLDNPTCPRGRRPLLLDAPQRARSEACGLALFLAACGGSRRGRRRTRWAAAFLAAALAAALPGCQTTEPPASTLVADTPTRARSDGEWISCREHIIDDDASGGVPIRGGDGLEMADLDGDGHLDIVSVHESDTEYGNEGAGHVRLAFGGPDPGTWRLATLAEGDEASAAEDVAIADFDGDGDLDVVAACELAHLIYFENPGADTEDAAAALRSGDWPRVIPPVTRDRGSYIRVFAGDLDGDGRPEVVAANKGAQNPDRQNTAKNPISWFDTTDDPISGEWIEHEIVQVIWPINSQTVDLDGDGDTDIVAGSTGESRIFWFENRSRGAGDVALVEHPIRVEGTTTTADTPRLPNAPQAGALLNGFNMEFVDLSGDGRLDLATVEFGGVLVWLEQPADPAGAWQLRPIGRLTPDNLVGFAFADIDGDGDLDAMSGAYSRSGRAEDGEVEPDTPLGRLAWFENPGDINGEWTRHDISRRKRGMFDSFVAHDMDGDGDVDFAGTRGNSAEFDGVFWLEQVRTEEPVAAFDQAREVESEQMPLP